jgi:hypothetical protein
VTPAGSRVTPAKSCHLLARIATTPSPQQSPPQRVRQLLRPIARRFGLAASEGSWWELGFKPWVNPKTISAAEAVCNICHWSGDEFIGPYHTEMATCPRCGSVARDRFLLFCFSSRRAYAKNLRVLETSPGMGSGYRSMMRRYFKYTASDYDLSACLGPCFSIHLL